MCYLLEGVKWIVEYNTDIDNVQNENVDPFLVERCTKHLSSLDCTAIALMHGID